MHTFDENIKLTVGLEPTAVRTDVEAAGEVVDMARYNNCAAIIQQAGETQWQGAVTYCMAEGTTATQIVNSFVATVTLSSSTIDQIDTIEIRAEELTAGYQFIRVEATPDGGTANAISVTMAQFNPRFAPV